MDNLLLDMTALVQTGLFRSRTETFHDLVRWDIIVVISIIRLHRMIQSLKEQFGAGFLNFVRKLMRMQQHNLTEGKLNSYHVGYLLVCNVLSTVPFSQSFEGRSCRACPLQ
jgi:hypothetical protein